MRKRLLALPFLSFLIAFPAAASISGVVINTDGQPISGARVSIYAPETIEAHRVRLFSKSAHRTPLASKQSDSKGVFTFDSPKAQTVVDVDVEATGFAPESVRLLADDDAGAIAMVPAAMQRGTITSAGKPVAAATVVWMGAATDFVATTDADGHYSVPDPTKWANRVIVIHPDYAPLDEAAGFRTTPKVDQVLNAGITIRGRVIAEDAKTPVAKAAVQIDGFPLATTADDGTFTIAHAPKDWQELQTRSGNLSGLRARSNDASLNVRLSKQSKIIGTVRDSKTQLPLANAEVSLGSANPFGGRRRGFGNPGGPGGMGASLESALTDAKGNFSIPTTPGRYNLSATYPGSSVSDAVVSVATGQTVSKSLWSTARARVSGVVIDDSKRGVAGARLAARRAGRDGGTFFIGGGGRMQADASAYSGPDGRFVLRNVPTDAEMEVDASKKGMPSSRSAAVRLTSGERKSGLVITIPHGVAFTGKVTDSSGKPLSGVAIQPVESTGGRGGGMRRMIVSLAAEREDDMVRSGSDGSFAVRVKEGTYDVVFRREGFATRTLRSQHVTASSTPVEVKLDPGVEISGRVVRSGVGVEGVNVDAISEDGRANAVTSSDGSFTLTDLTPGQMMVNVMKPDAFIQQIRPMNAPARDVVIELPPGGRISGRVVDKSNHSPITTFQAGIAMTRGSGGMVIAMPPMLKPFTSDDGTFTLENVPVGPTQLVVSAAGYTTSRVPGINVEEGKAVTDVEVALDTGVHLTGRVTGPDGSPLAGVVVRESGSNAGPARMMMPTDSRATTDPNGEYSIDSVDPGEKTFNFSRQGYLSVEKSVSLSGREARLDAQLSSGMPLNGVVVTESGAPVADASVNAMSAANSSFGSGGRTDSNGNFQIAGLAPGHYTLVAQKTGLADGRLTDFDISAGAPARIVMKAGGTISGRVSGLTEAELQSTTVTANSPTGNASAETDSTGAYRIDGAPTGTVRVSARTGRGFGPGGKTSSVQSVQIDPGSSVQVDIQFKSDTVISGRVTRNGQPMANVMVSFFPRNAQSQTSSSGTTDTGGSYQISGLDDGTYNVGVVDIDRSNAFSSSYDVHGSGTFDIDIKTASLRGRVIDATSGQPLSDVTVQIQSSQGMFGSRTVLTDPSGSFFVDNIGRGSYHAVAQKDGYGHDMRDLTIGDSAPDDLEFKLAPSGGVTIHVVDSRDNRQLSANVIRVVDSSGQQIQSGGFRFNSGPDAVKLTLSPGSYTVTLTAMGYAPKVVNVTSPSEITIGMVPGGSLLLRSKSSSQQRVRLIDPSGTVYPRGQNGIFMLDPSPLTTTINNIAAGTYTLQVLNSSDQVVNSIPITVVDGQQAVADI